MTDITGTSGNDTLAGTSGDDLILGLDGNDNLTGGGGNDRLEGGVGEDSLNGGEGNDLLLGGDDRDTLHDNTGGNDELEGGGGNDDVRIWRAASAAAGTHRMDGGAGDDFFGVYDESRASTFNISAGDGNDSLWIRGAAAVAIDAGAGDDMIELEGVVAAVSIALGSGGVDRIRVNGSTLNSFGGSITATGFDSGDSGDSLDIAEFLSTNLKNWDYRTNPFASGHLRLVQSGADALLQVDRDGGNDSYVTFVTFVATSAASLTGYNLGGWPSDGSVPAGVELVGDAVADDTLTGGAGDDFIQGLGGRDQIRGGIGDDRLEGGAGGDWIYGGLGDDLIEGGDGDDFLSGDLRGADVLRGGEGDDDLAAGRGSAESGWIELDGGAGDDRLTAVGREVRHLPDSAIRFRLIGGEGADYIYIYRPSEVVVDAGAGNDIVDLDTYSDALITLGAGADVLKLDQLRGFLPFGRTITVTDFQAGAGGDRLDWSAYLTDALPNWDRTSNPFLSFVRLVQSGDDTLVQVSRFGNPAEFSTLLTLENVQASELTQYNLGGFPSDGSPPLGETLTGTENADQLNGGGGDDTIYGLGADDVLRGGGGDDLLYGGDGRDQLVGELGSDRSEGGAGADFLEDRSGGDDSMYGGDGNDFLYVERNGTPTETLFLDGGADNDYLSYIGQYAQNLPMIVTMLGGDGADNFVLNGRATATLDAGAGDDHVTIYTDPGHYGVTLGEGSDSLVLWSDLITTGTVTVADFQTGDAGDRLDLNGWFSSALTGWDGVQSPLATGHARLVETGGAAVLQVDRNGGGDGYSTLLTLSGISLFSLTSVNFGGFDPVTKGTTGADDMAGTAGADFFHGGPGNDFLLFHAGGEDVGYGGEGNDVIYFGAALSPGDVADGGVGRDALVLQGNVVVTLSDTNLVGIESISIQSGANTRFGDTSNNLYDFDVTTADGNVLPGQQLIVNAQSLRSGEDFKFNGAAETDGKFLVYGGHGVDDLTGGAGVDVFFFEGSRWGENDKVDGGGGRDALVISGGSGVTRIEFGADSLTNIESISLNKQFATDPSQKPSYELVLHNGNVASGGTLIVNGNSLVDPTQTVDVDGSGVEDGNLILFGGAGNDALTGGDGTDLIYGAGGADDLAGGAGADTFRYDSVSDSTAGVTDEIAAFLSGADRIDLSRIDADSTAAGNQAFHWIGSNAFTGGGAGAGELRVFQSGEEWFVAGDTDGDGVADLLISVVTQSAAPLVQGDFLL